MGLNVFLRAGAMTRPPSVSPVTNREIRWGRTITLTVIENEPRLREGSHRNYGNTPEVELRGIEPLTSTVRLLRSTN